MVSKNNAKQWQFPALGRVYYDTFPVGESIISAFHLSDK
jgi:hypothetical protein